MKSIGYRILALFVGLIVLGATASPNYAQDKEKKEVTKELKVLVDDDGNITVNGEPVKEGDVELSDGSRIVVKKVDGRVVVVDEGGDGGERVIRKRIQGPDSDEDGYVIFMDSDDDGVHKIRRRIRVPEFEVDDDVHVLMERLGEGPHGLMEWHSDASDFGDKMRVLRMRAPKIAGEDFDFDFDFDFDHFDHPSSEVMKMEMETQKLARKVREADGAEKAQLERELSEKLSEIFDRKQEMRQKKIEKLQKQIEKERAQLNERRGARDEIINRRRGQLLGDDKWEW